MNAIMKNLQSVEIDKLIHEPARYNIMALLYVVESAEFLFVLRQTDMTPGNLSSHIRKLEDAGYVKVRKKFRKKMPLTLLSLTPKGQTAFEDYRQKMQEMLNLVPHKNAGK